MSKSKFVYSTLAALVLLSQALPAMAIPEDCSIQVIECLEEHVEILPSKTPPGVGFGKNNLFVFAVNQLSEHSVTGPGGALLAGTGSSLSQLETLRVNIAPYPQDRVRNPNRLDGAYFKLCFYDLQQQNNFSVDFYADKVQDKAQFIPNTDNEWYKITLDKETLATRFDSRIRHASLLGFQILVNPFKTISTTLVIGAVEVDNTANPTVRIEDVLTDKLDCSNYNVCNLSPSRAALRRQRILDRRPGRGR